MTLPHNATPAATALVATLQTRIDTLAASIVTAVRMGGACSGRVCVLAGVVVQQQGAWRRPTSLNFDNPVFPSVERLTPTAENFFFDLDIFRQHKKWSIWCILSKTRLSKKAFFDKFFRQHKKWPNRIFSGRVFHIIKQVIEPGRYGSPFYRDVIKNLGFLSFLAHNALTSIIHSECFNLMF